MVLARLLAISFAISAVAAAVWPIRNVGRIGVLFPVSIRPFADNSPKRSEVWSAFSDIVLTPVRTPRIGTAGRTFGSGTDLDGDRAIQTHVVAWLGVAFSSVSSITCLARR
jgi:hypothetical protein